MVCATSWLTKKKNDMKIFITGGLGYIGRHLSKLLLAKGYNVVAVGRRPSQNLIKDERFKYVSADTTKQGEWQNELQDIDAVFNLTGQSIFHVWSKNYKKSIYDSRILTTRNLVNALPDSKRGTLLCSASASGYYGDRGDDVLSEKEPPGRDFLAIVCRDWEKEAFQATKKSIRVTTTRIGVVLGRNGGAIKRMIPAFRLYLGGAIGNGQQWFPWIHMRDLLAAMIFILENKKISGPLNLTAPGQVRNRDFTKTFAKAINRPAVMPAPAFLLSILLGEFGKAILCSQKAAPAKLIKHGFSFQYPEVSGAIKNILK